jgi:hypothetical protein
MNRLLFIRLTPWRRLVSHAVPVLGLLAICVSAYGLYSAAEIGNCLFRVTR